MYSKCPWSCILNKVTCRNNTPRLHKMFTTTVGTFTFLYFKYILTAPDSSHGFFSNYWLPGVSLLSLSFSKDCPLLLQRLYSIISFFSWRSWWRRLGWRHHRCWCLGWTATLRNLFVTKLATKKGNSLPVLAEKDCHSTESNQNTSGK